jgi:alpha-tubulin suppressor-like RCC1 family protein
MKKQVRKIILTASFCVIGLNTVLYSQSIAGGGMHSIFICNDSTVMACGTDAQGALGDGTTVSKSTPVQINSLSGVIAVAGGDRHSLFLKQNGTVWSCGANNYLQLGDGSGGVDQHTPVKINSISGIVAISAGWRHSLFVKNDGTVWACGDNGSGQLGDGSTNSPLTTVNASSLSGITATAAGQSHSIFLKNDSTVWICGDNGHGQLGDGTTTTRHTPVLINSLTGIIAIAAGQHHSLFIKKNGTVWACGRNDYGQLGDGTTIERHSPVQVNSLTGIIAVGAGGATYHSLFLKNDGSVWACGTNVQGQLGNGTNTTKDSIPVQVSSLSGITAIATGNSFSLYHKNDGTVWASGGNGFGNLGNGTFANSNVPVQTAGLCAVMSIEENSEKNILKVFPNPSAGIIQIGENGTAFPVTIELINVLGKTVLKQEINSPSEIIDLSSFENGLYALLFSGKSKSAGCKKLIIQK